MGGATPCWYSRSRSRLLLRSRRSRWRRAKRAGRAEVARREGWGLNRVSLASAAMSLVKSHEGWRRCQTSRGRSFGTHYSIVWWEGWSRKAAFSSTHSLIHDCFRTLPLIHSPTHSLTLPLRQLNLIHSLTQNPHWFVRLIDLWDWVIRNKGDLLKTE